MSKNLTMCQKFVKIEKNWQKLLKIVSNTQNCQILTEFFVKNRKNYQKMSKFLKIMMFKKVSKNVKDCLK